MGGTAELLGRDDEIGFLLGEIALVRTAGRSVTLGVEGEPGVGKTALLHEIAQRSGLRSHWIAGHEHGRNTPMDAVGQLLRSLPRAAWAGLDRVDRDTLEAVLGRGTIAGQSSVVRALVAVLGAAATEPVLLVIDDAQWIDPSSQQVFIATLPRLAGDSIGVLVATRAVPNELAGAVRRLHLTGLSAAAAGALGRRLGLEATVADELAARTEGNPLATITVARGLSSEQRRGQVELPHTLEIGYRLVDAYRTVIDALPASTRRALAVVAVADGTPEPVVEQALAAAGLADALEPARTDELILGVTFVHPLMRSAVLASADPADLVAAHRLLTDALDPTADAERWAWHVSESAPDDHEVVAEAFLVAGDAASARGSRVAAGRYYETSANLATAPADRYSRALRAALLLICYGDAESGRNALELAIGTAPSLDEELLASALRPLVSSDVASVSFRNLMTSATDHADAAPAAAQFHLLCAAQLAAMDGDFAALAEAADAVATIEARAGGAGGPISALLGEMKRSLVDGRPELFVVPAMAQMALAYEDHAVLPEHVGLAGDTTGGFAYAAATLLAHERWDESITTLERVYAHNATTGWHGAFAEVAVWLVEAYWRTGRWNEAFLTATASLEIYRDGRSSDRAAQLLATTAKVQAGLGRLDELAVLDTAFAGSAGGLEFHTPRMTLAHAHALAALAEGRWQEAADALAPVAEWAGPELHPGWMWWEADHLEALARLGKPGFRPRLARFVQRTDGFPVLRAQGLRCAAIGETDDRVAVRSLTESVELLAASPAGFEHARSLLELGRRQLAGHRAAARRTLDDAATRFGLLGADRWQLQAARLADVGDRAARPLSALSDRELRVALLVADGLSNKKIAAELGVSPKTVEFHLGNVFRKYGISSRTELVREITRR